MLDRNSKAEPQRMIISLNQRFIETRLSLITYAAGHTSEELLTRTLDEVSAYVDSPIGFYHFIEPDQKTISLQQWSTRTVKEFCRAEGRGLHYDIEQAGVWVDCVKAKKPVVHNDYASLPHKKGLPEGHIRVVRELVAPVSRDGKVVAILGVGNKPVDYTDDDVNIVSFFADVTWEIVSRKRAEQELRRSNDMLRAIIDTAPVAIIGLDLDGNVDSVWNKEAEKMFGWRAREVMGRPIPAIPEECSEGFDEFREQVRNGLIHDGVEVPAQRRDGSLIHCSLHATSLRCKEGDIIGEIDVLVDITERKTLEEQFRQAQKMESVGRLAGGVAHDFNNLLSVIMGNVELALEKADQDRQIVSYLQGIQKAANRSTDLIKQLLAFARKQTVEPRVLDLNATVKGMLKILRRLIGEDINLSWKPMDKVWPVKMDPSQIDQIVANLCVNARDAITGGGIVTIGTKNITLDESYCTVHAGFSPGDYALLVVSDNGCGMDRETLDKIFEPFFTTKGLGKGTGLGLATVYGIVKQNNGFINVYSEPGQGTTVKIYLPRHPSGSDPVQAENETPAIVRGDENILVVEYEPVILKLANEILRRLGYRVLTANSPDEAIRVAKEYGDAIHLLITDVVMPGMNGPDLASKLRDFYPELRILYMSGYTEDTIAHHGVLDESVHFIQKPFSVQSLSEKIREVLDRG